jgi:hypothetical protein
MASPEERRALLLSASYPPREYMERSDTHEIAAAVKALAGAVFQKGWTLVFGGHPTISPLVLMIAREYDCKDRVVIYQSAYFKHHISPAVQSLAFEHYGHVELVRNDPGEPPPGPDEELNPARCPRSLALMRESMMKHPEIAALVLIGGDTGVRQELDLFAQKHEDLPMIPIGAPGGIARELVHERRVPGMKDSTAEALATSRNYMTLCTELVRYIASRPSPR